MMRRRLSYGAFLFFLFLFLLSWRRLISVNQDLDMKNLIEAGLTIQTSFDACPLKQIIPRKAQRRFSTLLYEIRKINRTIDYEKDNEYKRCRPTDELWKLPAITACTLFLHIH